MLRVLVVFPEANGGEVEIKIARRVPSQKAESANRLEIYPSIPRIIKLVPAFILLHFLFVHWPTYVDIIVTPSGCIQF